MTSRSHTDDIKSSSRKSASSADGIAVTVGVALGSETVAFAATFDEVVGIEPCGLPCAGRWETFGLEQS